MTIGYVMQSGVPDLLCEAPSGAANHVRHTLRGLRLRGHQVRVLANFANGLSFSADGERFELIKAANDRIQVQRIVESGVRRIQSALSLPYVSYFDSRRFAASCKTFLGDCQVLYERMGWMGTGGSLAASMLRLPHVLEVNGDHLSEFELLGIAPRGLQRRLAIRLMRSVAQRARLTVAAGEGWRRRHIDRWKVEPSSVRVVHNGSEFVHRLRREQLRSFRDVAPAAPIRIIYVGSFDPWQGLPRLLSAVRDSVSQGISVELTLAGTGILESKLKHLASELGVARQVRFTGHLTTQALADELRESDVGVALYEGRAEYSGLKLLDYKAAGLATIASGEDGEPTLIDHEQTGLIIPPGDVSALREAIVALVKSPDRRREMGRRARLEAEKKHGWSHTVGEIESLLQDVIRSGK